MIKIIISRFFILRTSIAFQFPVNSRTKPIRTFWTLTPLASSIPLDILDEDTSTIEKGKYPSQNQKRFDRTAPSESVTEKPCILHIEGNAYNLTAWAKSHPGGNKVLERFNDKDATKAFFSAGHSQQAINMLSEFLVKGGEESSDSNSGVLENANDSDKVTSKKPILSRVRVKLFTKEDPIGIHKYCGIFVLLHFAYRYFQSYFGDITSGMGSHGGKGSSFLSLACIIPHSVLSLSSLIFHTVPRERIVGRPMIWQEFRAHNIIFAMRSIICTILAWISVYDPKWRRVAVVGSSLTCLSALYAADIATDKLREDEKESTTATMPYWEGCTIETQRKFKTFYAYCQFMATFACLLVLNPAWPLLALLPIQLASLLMTLVRKGLLTAKGYHIGYTISLCMPYMSLVRALKYTKTMDVPLMAVLSSLLFALRRRGLNKYGLWGSAAVARILLGDKILNWEIWAN